MPLPLYYNLRNLQVRKLSSTLTFIVVAAVVFVLLSLLAFAAGIRASLAASGSARNLIVLAPGATAESTSIILPTDANRLIQTPGVARDASGAPLISQEVCTQTSIPRVGPDGTLANVAVRGVDDVAWAVHSEVHMIEGRRFEQGALEVVVGKAARSRYADLDIGQALSLGRLGNRAFKVVGIFEAGGAAVESEIWAPRTILADVYNRRLISSALIHLADGASAQGAIDYINGPAVNLGAKLETQYYDELSAKTREIVALTTVLISIMALGAAFAVANTMYAAVDGRRGEIAMLRAIGFSSGSIVIAFVLESLLICVPACGLALGGSLLIHGIKQDFFSDVTFTVLVYELKVTPAIVGTALGVTVLVAVAGALAPASRAARIRIIEGLRKA